MDQANRPFYSRRNQSYKFLEAECFGANRVADRTPLLVNGVNEQLRHVLHVDGTNRVPPVAWNPEHGKTAHEPGNVVDEYVFRPKNDGGPQDCVRQPRADYGLFDLGLSPVVPQRRFERWIGDADGTPCRMPVWALPEQAGPEWVLRAPSGRVIARMPEGSLHFDQVYWPFLDGVEDLSKIEALYPEHMWTGVASPPGPSVSGPAELAEGARALRANTDRAIAGLFGGNLLEMGQFYYRMDNFLMMLAGEPAS